MVAQLEQKEKDLHFQCRSHDSPTTGGAEGQASDIAIRAEWMLKTKKNLIKMMSKVTGQPESKVEKDVDRDFWMSADEAKKYGIVDKVILDK